MWSPSSGSVQEPWLQGESFVLGLEKKKEEELEEKKEERLNQRKVKREDAKGSDSCTRESETEVQPPKLPKANGSGLPPRRKTSLAQAPAPPQPAASFNGVPFPSSGDPPALTSLDLAAARPTLEDRSK